MKFRTIATALLLGLWVSAITLPASAQEQQQSPGAQCGLREKVEEHLRGKYGESPVFIGLTANGDNVAETWLNEKTRTWTFSVTTPQGIMCLVASGENAEVLPAINIPQGEDM